MEEKMHIIRCPQCGKSLRVSREVRDGTFRCKACGNVFRGSTRTVEEDEPKGTPPGGTAASPPRQRPRPIRRKPSPVPLVVVAVLTLGVMGLVIGIWYFHHNPRVAVKDQSGRVTERGRASRREIDQRIEQQEADRNRVTETPSQRLRRQTEQHRRGEEVTDRPPGSDPNAIQAGQRYGSGAVAEPETSGDENIRVTDIEPVSGPTGDYGDVTGQVRNLYDSSVSSLVVRVTLVLETGQKVPLEPKLVRYIPREGAVGFSVKYSGYSIDQIDRYRAQVSDVQTDPGLLCLAIPAGECRRDVRDGNTIVIYGRARNSTQWTAESPRAYCDFYTDDGVHRGANQALPADGQTRVPPGGTFSFEVTYETMMPQLIEEFLPRIVARKKP